MLLCQRQIRCGILILYITTATTTLTRFRGLTARRHSCFTRKPLQRVEFLTTSNPVATGAQPSFASGESRVATVITTWQSNHFNHLAVQWHLGKVKKASMRLFNTLTFEMREVQQVKQFCCSTQRLFTGLLILRYDCLVSFFILSIYDALF